MAHNNTLFSQILSFIPRHVFKSLERKHQTGRSSRRFGFKEQFIVMAFIHLAARSSLRDGLRCITAVGQRLYHWGLTKVARSTICDANRDRPADFFHDLFSTMYQICKTKASSHKFRFKAKLFSIDSTTISLCLSLFPWANFRRSKAGVKIHTMIDHDGHIPAFAIVTNASVHDSKITEMLTLPKGSIVVFDKAYNDYRWFKLLSEKGSSFVARMKSNTKFRLVKRNLVNRKNGVTSDHTIEVSRKDDCLRLRCIGYRDPESGKHFKFLTNNFLLSPKTIAEIYKARWQIELFFKEIKQNLQIKKFVGRSENAIMIQIYTAMIVYLLMAYMKFISKIGISVQQLLQLVQLNLFDAKTLLELLNPRQKEKTFINDFPLLSMIP